VPHLLARSLTTWCSREGPLLARLLAALLPLQQDQPDCTLLWRLEPWCYLPCQGITMTDACPGGLSLQVHGRQISTPPLGLNPLSSLSVRATHWP